MKIHRLKLLDYGSLFNALITHATPPVSSTVSFTLRWTGNTGSATVRNEQQQFDKRGILTHATLEWSAHVPSQHFTFKSAPASQSQESYAELVRERNGSLLNATGEDDDHQD
jgi:hypothetical protein